MSRPQEYRVYKPRKSNDGAAIAFQLSYKEKEYNGKKYPNWMVFMVATKQTGTDSNGNASFDWKEKAINVKLGENDLGEIIAVLERRKQSVGTKGSLFHETPGGGNKIIGFEYNKDRGFYSLSVSSKDKSGGLSKVNLTVSDSEASILLVLLKRAVEKIYQWD